MWGDRVTVEQIILECLSPGYRIPVNKVSILISQGLYFLVCKVGQIVPALLTFGVERGWVKTRNRSK
jgi:hypothetical protein